jgi:hypothetical protein
MRKPLLPFLLLLAFSVPGYAKPATPAVHADTLRCGIFEIQGERTRVRDPREPAGFRTVWKQGSTFKLVKATRRIPAKSGTIFGCTYRLRGLTKGSRVTLYRQYIHPPMTDKSGRKTTTFTLSKTGFAASEDIQEAILYTLRQEFELVPGKWTLSVTHRGKRLFTERFIVFKPSPP